ncbi:hypothetical protein PPERSA_10255 [Pseudocohnilembus persalinus]|uniref:Transmembrane protein n=1 Tax=Pseudocohnilembus persalinus TaxID=266149 RepID=A0A0V0R095_PSEPJ|nr:hypothetical protein PPERSA_10255 [Pseudocohnilembus persalinus]|eukprot:KRX07867.1 hypothetical protein PPERSA_10255 [Pseudocohnilembus persalinus]
MQSHQKYPQNQQNNQQNDSKNQSQYYPKQINTLNAPQFKEQNYDFNELDRQGIYWTNLRLIREQFRQKREQQYKPFRDNQNKQMPKFPKQHFLRILFFMSITMVQAYQIPQIMQKQPIIYNMNYNLL